MHVAPTGHPVSVRHQWSITGTPSRSRRSTEDRGAHEDGATGGVLGVTPALLAPLRGMNVNAVDHDVIALLDRLDPAGGPCAVPGRVHDPGRHSAGRVK